VGTVVYFAPRDQNNVGVLDTVTSAFSTIATTGDAESTGDLSLPSNAPFSPRPVAANAATRSQANSSQHHEEGATPPRGALLYVMKPDAAARATTARSRTVDSDPDVIKARALSLERWPSAAVAGAVKARLCPNGWGDRMLSMLAFATIWHLDGASRLLLFWPENERTGPAFAAANNFSRVQHHFVLQRGIRITADWHTFVHEPAFWYEHDGAKSQDLFPSTISRTFNRPLPQVQRAYAHIRTRLVKPSDSLSRVLQRLPVDFIGLHLRRGDKVRRSGIEGLETNQLISTASDHEPMLRRLTWTSIPDDGRPVLVCSDDEIERQHFAEQLGKRALAPLTSDFAEVADTTFLEFFALARASTIVLSQRWSAFSFSACMTHRGCEYHIAYPHGAHLQYIHRSGFQDVVQIRPRLLHIVGCNCNKRGSTLQLPPHLLHTLSGSGAVLSNACLGLKWPPHPPSDYDPHPTLLKPTAVLHFLQRIVSEGDKDSVVLFVENDVLVNFDGTADIILRRFDAVRGGSSIVLGVEPFCWLSRECTPSEMAVLYPEAVTQYSRCPAFVNSGLYIGEAHPLLELMLEWIKRTEPGDQERLAKVVHKGTHRVHLDRHEALFATAMTSTLLEQGVRTTHAAPCAGNTKCLADLTIQHAWNRGNSSDPWQRLASYQAECGTGTWPGPLFIHGNGPGESMLPGLGFPQAAHSTTVPTAVTTKANVTIRVIAKSCLIHSDRWQPFKLMWGWRLAFLYVGDPSILPRFQLREKLLRIRTGDGYDNLASKFILALAFYARRMSGPVFHVDDDARLAGPFRPQLAGIDYGGPRIQGSHRLGANRTSHWDRVPPGSYWYRRLGPPHNAMNHTFVHGGCGWYLSSRAVALLLARWNESNTELLFRTEIYDDVVVSDVLASHGIFAQHVAGSNVIGDKPEQGDDGGPRRCARANTVVGATASASFAPALHALAASAWAAGRFPCVIVSTPSDIKHSSRIYPLPQPQPTVLPGPMWCNASDVYGKPPFQAPMTHMWGWRLSHFYRARLWRAVLHLGLDLLCLDVDWRMTFDPLPGIRAASMDIVALWDKPPAGGFLNVGNMWLRSSPVSRAFVTVVENRTSVGWDQQVFNEELNFNKRFASLSCCHSKCLARAAVKNESSPKKDAGGLERRHAVEGHDRCLDRGNSLQALPPPANSPELWRQSWSVNTYNKVVADSLSRPVGRCNSFGSACTRWAEPHCRQWNQAARTPAEPGIA